VHVTMIGDCESERIWVRGFVSYNDYQINIIAETDRVLKIPDCCDQKEKVIFWSASRATLKSIHHAVLH